MPRVGDIKACIRGLLVGFGAIAAYHQKWSGQMPTPSSPSLALLSSSPSPSPYSSFTSLTTASSPVIETPAITVTTTETVTQTYSYTPTAVEPLVKTAPTVSKGFALWMLASWERVSASPVVGVVLSLWSTLVTIFGPAIRARFARWWYRASPDAASLVKARRKAGTRSSNKKLRWKLREQVRELRILHDTASRIQAQTLEKLSEAQKVREALDIQLNFLVSGAESKQHAAQDVVAGAEKLVSQKMRKLHSVAQQVKSLCENVTKEVDDSVRACIANLGNKYGSILSEQQNVKSATDDLNRFGKELSYYSRHPQDLPSSLQAARKVIAMMEEEIQTNGSTKDNFEHLRKIINQGRLVLSEAKTLRIEADDEARAWSPLITILSSAPSVGKPKGIALQTMYSVEPVHPVAPALPAQPPVVPSHAATSFPSPPQLSQTQLAETDVFQQQLTTSPPTAAPRGSRPTVARTQRIRYKYSPFGRPRVPRSARHARCSSRELHRLSLTLPEDVTLPPPSSLSPSEVPLPESPAMESMTVLVEERSVTPPAVVVAAEAPVDELPQGSFESSVDVSDVDDDDNTDKPEPRDDGPQGSGDSSDDDEDNDDGQQPPRRPCTPIQVDMDTEDVVQVRDSRLADMYDADSDVPIVWLPRAYVEAVGVTPPSIPPVHFEQEMDTATEEQDEVEQGNTMEISMVDEHIDVASGIESADVQFTEDSPIQADIDAGMVDAPSLDAVLEDRADMNMAAVDEESNPQAASPQHQTGPLPVAEPVVTEPEPETEQPHGAQIPPPAVPQAPESLSINDFFDPQQPSDVDSQFGLEGSIEAAEKEIFDALLEERDELPTQASPDLPPQLGGSQPPSESNLATSSEAELMAPPDTFFLGGTDSSSSLSSPEDEAEDEGSASHSSSNADMLAWLDELSSESESDREAKPSLLEQVSQRQAQDRDFVHRQLNEARAQKAALAKENASSDKASDEENPSEEKAFEESSSEESEEDGPGREPEPVARPARPQPPPFHPYKPGNPSQGSRK